MNDLIPTNGIPLIARPGALSCADSLVSFLGLTGRGIAVYDDDSFRAAGPKPAVFRSILFDNEQLKVNDLSLHYLRKQCEQEGNWLIAIGGEAVISITKLVAAATHMPWISAPVCAFGTGIASDMALMETPLGLTRSKGCLPTAVLADTGLMALADRSITLGAIRELADYAGQLAENRAVALACGYKLDEASLAERQKAIDVALRRCSAGLGPKDNEAYIALCSVLVLCGQAGSPLPSDPRRLHHLR